MKKPERPEEIKVGMEFAYMDFAGCYFEVRALNGEYALGYTHTCFSGGTDKIKLENLLKKPYEFIPNEFEEPSMRAQAMEFMRAFRFQVRTDFGTKIDTAEMHWEGPHLVMKRALRKSPPSPSLYDELLKVKHLKIVLFDNANTVFKAWLLEWMRVQNRGFLFMDAADAGVALEACCLVDARMTEIDAGYESR